MTRVTKCKLISESRCHYDNKKHNLFKYYIHIYNVIRIEINVKHTQKRRKMKNAKKKQKKQVIKPIIRNVCYCLIRALVIP